MLFSSFTLHQPVLHQTVPITIWATAQYFQLALKTKPDILGEKNEFI